MATTKQVKNGVKKEKRSNKKQIIASLITGIIIGSSSTYYLNLHKQQKNIAITKPNFIVKDKVVASANNNIAYTFYNTLKESQAKSTTKQVVITEHKTIKPEIKKEVVKIEKPIQIEAVKVNVDKETKQQINLDREEENRKLVEAKQLAEKLKAEQIQAELLAKQQQEITNKKELERQKALAALNGFDTTQIETNATQMHKNSLQIASFRSQQDATKLQQQLQAFGVNNFIESTQINNVNYYRVIAGPFQSSQQINNASSKVANLGYNPQLIYR